MNFSPESHLRMPATSTLGPLTPELMHRMNAYWRAANYLSVGQIYLYDNPLLKRPLEMSDVKPLIVGHWGTTPGQNFIYVHLNRVIKKFGLDMFYVAGPGHGGPALVGNTYLEGSYSEIYPDVSVEVPAPGAVDAQDTLVLGQFLRDVVKLNQELRNFRIFGPDETLSNSLGAVFEETSRQWDAQTLANDEFLAPAGRVLDSMLSEHQCEGWLEGYLLTGRHGLFNCYEAFVHIVDSMFNQHAKWLKVTSQLPWRRNIASLNYLLTSHVWQQDHNGFTHQDPGFLDHVVNKKADIVRVYLPPDANCLLSVFDHCLRSQHYVNVVVAGKRAMPHTHGQDLPEIRDWTWTA